MQYIGKLAEYNGSGRAAVTFGKFDGLHRGHQVLVTSMSAHLILGLYSVPRVWLFAN